MNLFIPSFFHISPSIHALFLTIPFALCLHIQFQAVLHSSYFSYNFMYFYKGKKKSLTSSPCQSRGRAEGCSEMDWAQIHSKRPLNVPPPWPKAEPGWSATSLGVGACPEGSPKRANQSQSSPGIHNPRPHIPCKTSQFLCSSSSTFSVYITAICDLSGRI